MPTKRKSLKPVTRFEVFKRDAFTCQYCGGKPPTVLLVVDHVHPIAKGGTDEFDNLITACEGCNQGKAARLLEAVPDSLAKRAEILQEKRLQMVEYEKLLRQERRRVEKQVDRIQQVFTAAYKHSFTETGRQSIRRFLTKLPAEVLLEYMALAVSRISDPGRGFKYFCGICWRTIKGPREDDE